MLSAFVTELLTLTFTVNASPPRVGISGRYPIILPIELLVHRLIIKLNQTYAQAFYRLRTSRTRPEFVTGLAVSLGVGNERCGQLQNILFAVNIREGIIMHRLSEIDGVKDPDAVSILQKGLAAVDYDIAFRVSDHIGTVTL